MPIHVHQVCIHMIYLCISGLMYLDIQHVFFYLFAFRQRRFCLRRAFQSGLAPSISGVAFHGADASVVRLVAASPGLLFGCGWQERGHLESKFSENKAIYPIIEYPFILIHDSEVPLSLGLSVQEYIGWQWYVTLPKYNSSPLKSHRFTQ